MIYFCCDDRRRNAVSEHPTLNGIDFIEVSDESSSAFTDRQRTLFVHFIKNISTSLTEKNFLIEGGERVQNIKVIRVDSNSINPPATDTDSPLHDASRLIQSDTISIEVSEAGDYSTYTLRLVRSAGDRRPPNGFDPVLSAITFSFKVTCSTEFDCKTSRACPPEPFTQPEINYLAKDYASFRQLILDRMAVLAPDWKERNPADLGIALVELLAYVGDYLSYQQDAVATEAYLNTARRRVSVKRHARLLDYRVSDGRNARVWIHIRARAGISGLLLKRGKGKNKTRFFTGIEGQSILLRNDSLADVMAAHPQVFELMDDVTLYAEHNEMKFYTWGDRECCLPKGATRATLRGSFPNLKPGDVLIFEEVRGPQTGEAQDADATHSHAVRLKKVTLSEDPLGGRFNIPADNNPIDVTEIEWGRADALPFALCISASNGTAFFDDVSVAMGNIALADHGQTFTDVHEGRPFDPHRDTTSLVPDTVPSPNPALTLFVTNATRCESTIPVVAPARYRPILNRSPLTHAAPYDPTNPPTSAYATLQLKFENSLQTSMPVITLNEPGVTDSWTPKLDLLNSGSDDKDFVVEIERDGTAYIRFGDDKSGSRPATGTKFLATYRIGNGMAGNVGADAIKRIASSDPAIITDLNNPVIIEVRNPLPATGGVDAESIERVRQNVPAAFRRQERAVTPEDYAEVAKRSSTDVQRAAATFRWTGSWRTVFVTVDRVGAEAVDEEFQNEMRRSLERYRMAGHDLKVDMPRFVSLEIEMIVCVKRHYQISDVKRALLEMFSNRHFPDGKRGFFHPDNFTFGQPVYLSSMIAAAQSITGVDSIEVTRFQRQGRDSNDAINSGKLELGRLEIARLDNNPDFPERGAFNLIMRGGR